jgi:parallel beta-helix repeat protein
MLPETGSSQIKADNITLDGTGVTIVGTNASHTGMDSDGLGITMNGHTGLTLRNFTIRGFRYGISIQDARGVLIENSNISGNLKDITAPWVGAATGGYGGGILFNRVWQSTVRNDVLTNQSTGLEMNDSHENSIINNKISTGPEGNEAGQVSCWGVRLSGSTANLVRGNIMDYVDRRRYPCHDPGCGDVDSCFGPRPGFLESGDSAGIMLINRSDHNRIISNSATHGGDGIFIGGTNNYNYVYGNDAAYSPHNAVEGTFSEGNIYENNITSNSCYGFWLGYSSRSRITNNEINDIILEGVAIEHGSDTEIDRNSILRGKNFGIHLWNYSGLEPSRDYSIHHNDISLNKIGLQLEDTSRSAIWRNQISNNSEANVSITRNIEGAPDLDISHNNLICQNTTSVNSNLVYLKPVTASKSNETALKAVDGNVINPASTWSPGTLVSGDYWQVDLGAIKSVSEVILYMSANPHDFPDKFKVFVLTTAAPIGGEVPVVNEANRDEKPVAVYDFAPVSGRYIRIVSSETRNWVQMAEFAAFTQQGQNPIACRYSIYSHVSNALEVSALYNWWGKTSEPAIMDSIFDQNDDANLGKVLYNPFLFETVSAPGVASGPGTGPWLSTTSLPQPSAAPFLDRGQQLIIYNDRVYLFGGQGPNNTRLTSVFFSRIRPDGTLTQWVGTTALPVAPFDQVVVRVGNHVYLITGAAAGRAVYFASINNDGTIGAWTSTMPITVTRQSFAAAADGNHIFVVGGNSGGLVPWVEYTTVKSDGSLNPWAYSRPLPEPIQSHAMVVRDGVLYVLAPSSRVYYAPINTDGTIGVWKTTASLPEGRSKFSAFESSSYLYLLGGTSAPDGGASRSVRSVAVLNDGALDQWQDIAQRQSIPDLPEQINGLRVGAYNGYIYALGGYDNNSLFKNTAYYSQFTVPGGCQGGENLTAPFLSGLNGAVSSLTYSGLSTVTVSGLGQALSTSFSDAFYVFADGNGNPVAPYRPTAFTLSLNGRKISDFVYATQQVPSYRPDHRYTFRINAPAGPLTFGVADASPADNTGQYLIGLCGGTP